MKNYLSSIKLILTVCLIGILLSLKGIEQSFWSEETVVIYEAISIYVSEISPKICACIINKNVVRLGLVIVLVSPLVVTVLILIVRFIYINISLLLLIYLIIIFQRIFLSKFYEKHFKRSERNMFNSFLNLWAEKKRLIRLILLVVICSLPLKIAVRTLIQLLFNGDDVFIANSLVIMLSLPFIFYGVNLISKFVNKNLESKDYSLYNDFVIEKTNLYNILYLIFSHWIISNYYQYYLIIITIIVIVILILIFCIYILPEMKSPESSSSCLQATPGGTSLAGTILLVGMSTELQDIELEPLKCELGDSFFYDKDKRWTAFSHKHVEGKTTNFYYTPFGQSANKKLDLVSPTNKAEIRNSKILTLLEEQKKTKVHSRPDWVIIPKSVFLSDQYVGTVCMLKRSKILFVTVYPKEYSHVPGSHLGPTYYLNNYLGSSEDCVNNAAYKLKKDWGIVIENIEKDKINRLVTFTPVEKMVSEHKKNHVKIWRPAGIDYQYPIAMSLSTYIRFENMNPIRFQNLNSDSMNNTGNNQQPISDIPTAKDNNKNYGFMNNTANNQQLVSQIQSANDNNQNLFKNANIETDIKLNLLYENYLTKWAQSTVGVYLATMMSPDLSDPNMQTEMQRFIMFNNLSSLKKEYFSTDSEPISIDSLYFYKSPDRLGTTIYEDVLMNDSINMSSARGEMITKFQEKFSNVYSSYAICTRGFSVELFFLQELPDKQLSIYSIMDINNKGEETPDLKNGISPSKFHYNILYEKDERSFRSFLDYHLLDTSDPNKLTFNS